MFLYLQSKRYPRFIEVDITSLEFGSNIHVLDVKYPDGVKPVVTGRNFTLVTASGIAEDVVEEPDADAEEMSSKVISSQYKQKAPEEKEDNKELTDSKTLKRKEP